MPTSRDDGGGGYPPQAGSARGRPELILITKEDAGVRFTASGARAVRGDDAPRLDAIAADPDITVTPLFADEERMRANARRSSRGAFGAEQDDVIRRMAQHYHVEAPEERLEEIAERLRGLDVVETAYVKPAAEPARSITPPRPTIMPVNDMAPTGPDAPPVSPDFTARQIYLNPAPAGIDARFAWTQPGGRGAGVRVVDCEWGWRFTHEDLTQNQGGVIAGENSAYSDHGTAVLGEISGDVNGIGVTGIAPDVVISASSFFEPTAKASKAAADHVGSGDIVLLEIHRPGPNATGVGQEGFIAIEWWPDDFLAIRYAVNRGVIVVEAAGNGAEDLDDPVYDTPADAFPPWWSNPFRRGIDSGAIIVGAGAPPPGTHGADWGADRSRLDFSNYGNCVDAQGWGREVTTTGYGDLQGGQNKDAWYTDRFSGTSSASPIVVGALSCVQGVLRAHGRTPLTPARARELLRRTGTPQQDQPGRPATQRIGNRPDLRQLIPTALATDNWSGVQFRDTVGAGLTQRWFTHGWPAHWHVVWTVVPTSQGPGEPQLSWRVRVERVDDANATYWIDVTNHVTDPVDFEVRFTVLGW